MSKKASGHDDEQAGPRHHQSRDQRRDGMRLWRAVAETVKPLHPPRASVKPFEDLPTSLTAPPPTSAEKIRQTRAAAPARVSTPTRRPQTSADRSGERRVRRGQVSFEAKLDLHGFTQDQAMRALAAFLARAQADGATSVLVVTGKGGRLIDGEATPGILRLRLREWLGSPALAQLTSGCAAAHRRHGGDGAFYVFIRKPRTKA